MTLHAEPLTAESFAPFGQVIEAAPESTVEINAGWTTRFHDLARADVEGAPAIISIFRSRVRPLVAEMLERHPFGTQAFVPLGGHPWLIVAAEAPDAPLRAFLARGDQGAQIGRGVWHHPLLTIGAQDFLVVDRADPDANLETRDLPAQVPVTL